MINRDLRESDNIAVSQEDLLLAFSVPARETGAPEFPGEDKPKLFRGFLRYRTIQEQSSFALVKLRQAPKAAVSCACSSDLG